MTNKEKAQKIEHRNANESKSVVTEVVFNKEKAQKIEHRNTAVTPPRTLFVSYKEKAQNVEHRNFLHLSIVS